MNDIKMIVYAIKNKQYYRKVQTELLLKTRPINKYLDEWQIITSIYNYNTECNKIFIMTWCFYRHNMIKNIGKRWWIEDHGDRTTYLSALEISNDLYKAKKNKRVI